MAKKLFLFLGIFLILSAINIYGYTYIQDYTAGDTTETYSGTLTWFKYYQFVANDSTLSQITMKLKKTGSPTGYLLFSLFADNANTAGNLITGRIAYYDVSTLPSSFTDINISLSGITNLTQGTKYWIGIKENNSNSWSYDITSVNFYSYSNSDTSPNYGLRSSYDAIPTYRAKYYPRFTYYFNATSNISAATTSSPSFVSPTPANNSYNNTQVRINMSCSNANRFYLWFNGSLVLNNSTNSSFLTNVSSSASYNYFGACYNASASDFSSNSSVYTWVYDVVYPSITLNSNNAFNSINLSQVDQYNGSVLLNITFADNILLYAYEVNVTSSGGVSMFNETNQSLSGTSFNYIELLNTTSWADGVYYFNIKVSDSHTAKKIENYGVSKASKKLSFDTVEGNLIEVESEDDSVVDSKKDLDRYSFEFNFTQKNKKNRVYHIRSDHKIVYLENSPFAAHFIVFNEKFGGNWIDFEGSGEIPEVVKVSDFDYKVIFKDSKDNVKFHSIGGLNTYQAIVSWYKGSKVLTAGIAGTLNPAVLSLNMTRDSVSQINFSAYLIYNGTVFSNVSKSLGSSLVSFSQNVTTPSAETIALYYWVGNITQSDGSHYHFNYSGSQNIYNWFLDNCSNSSVKALNLFIYNEENPSTSLNADMEVEVKSWIDSEANYHSNFIKFVGDDNYSICLYPNLTLMIDLYAKYNSSGNLTHRFYLQNTQVNNGTKNYSLYNAIDPLIYSSLQLTLRKTRDFSYYPEVLAKLQRYYISEGVWRTVQMDQSGNYGLISFDIEEGITDYRLLFYDSDDNILKTTDKMKFLCSSKVCSITQMLDPNAAAALSDNLSISISFDNSTKLLSISWSDPKANNNAVEIRVSKQTYTGDFYICNSFQTGAAGSYNCNLTGYYDQVLVSILTSHSPYKPIFSEWISLAKSDFSSLIGKSEGMTWTAGIMMVTIGAGVGFGAVGALIGGILGLIVNMFLGFASFLSITFIIVAMAIAIAIGIKIRQ